MERTSRPHQRDIGKRVSLFIRHARQDNRDTPRGSAFDYRYKGICHCDVVAKSRLSR